MTSVGSRPSAVVLGGYGTFGSLVARELAARGVTLAIAGRDLAKAQALAGELGPSHRAIRVDLREEESCLRAAREGRVVIHCAGPFGGQPPTVALACLAAGASYVDIAEDRGYVAGIRALDSRFRERGLAAVYGASSLPGLSGALARVLVEDGASCPMAVRVTLMIGNRNPKGLAAIRTLVESIGRPIAAPQGRLRGLGDPVRVRLPEPFGLRTVANFDSPEYDLFGPLLGARRIEVKVGFEMPLAIRLFSVLGAAGVRPGRRTASFLARAGAPFSRFGHSGGIVQVDCVDSAGRKRRSAIGGADQGQRMASLPAALASLRLMEGGPAGVFTAYELLGARPLLDAVASEGFPFRIDDGIPA